MKTNLLFLTALAFSINCMYAQNSDSCSIQFTKAQAITLLKGDYLFQCFKNPDNVSGNLDLFLNALNGMVGMTDTKREVVRYQILNRLQSANVEKMTVNDQLHFLPMADAEFIPVLGINVYDIISSNFPLQKEEIYTNFKNSRITATDAYRYLSKVYKREPINSDRIFTTLGRQKVFLDLMFPYFGI